MTIEEWTLLMQDLPLDQVRCIAGNERLPDMQRVAAESIVGTPTWRVWIKEDGSAGSLKDQWIKPDRVKPVCSNWRSR